MRTHRCKESLNQKASIRFEDGTWILYQIEMDWYSGSDDYYMRKIFDIIACPFCGTKLEESD